MKNSFFRENRFVMEDDGKGEKPAEGVESAESMPEHEVSFVNLDGSSYDGEKNTYYDITDGSESEGLTSEEVAAKKMEGAVMGKTLKAAKAAKLAADKVKGKGEAKRDAVLGVASERQGQMKVDVEEGNQIAAVANATEKVAEIMNFEGDISFVISSTRYSEKSLKKKFKNEFEKLLTEEKVKQLQAEKKDGKLPKEEILEKYVALFYVRFKKDNPYIEEFIKAEKTRYEIKVIVEFGEEKPEPKVFLKGDGSFQADLEAFKKQKAADAKKADEQKEKDEEEAKLATVQEKSEELRGTWLGFVLNLLFDFGKKDGKGYDRFDKIAMGKDRFGLALFGAAGSKIAGADKAYEKMKGSVPKQFTKQFGAYEKTFQKYFNMDSDGASKAVEALAAAAKNSEKRGAGEVMDFFKKGTMPDKKKVQLTDALSLAKNAPIKLLAGKVTLTPGSNVYYKGKPFVAEEGKETKVITVEEGGGELYGEIGKGSVFEYVKVAKAEGESSEAATA